MKRNATLRKVLITGGAGFIGCNAARTLLRQGWQVTILDNLSRRGAANNLKWLSGFGRFRFVKEDIRDRNALRRLFRRHGTEAVLHLAAQVSVTASVADPAADFEINARGTVNLLEAVRRYCRDAIFLFASTNKVYGALPGARHTERADAYALSGAGRGISEDARLDFLTPYACSKGAADQYVRDYARIYGMKCVVFRQSCVYGPRQFGLEDQGWVAWLMIARELGLPATIFGTGKQVRDLLYIDDLTDLYVRALRKIDRAAGEIFNAGGGPANALSLLQFVRRLGRSPGPEDWTVGFEEARPGDQKVYISDISKAKRLLGWEPRVPCSAGIERLQRWIRRNLAEIRSCLPAESRRET